MILAFIPPIALKLAVIQKQKRESVKDEFPKEEPPKYNPSNYAPLSTDIRELKNRICVSMAGIIEDFLSNIENGYFNGFESIEAYIKQLYNKIIP
ncbi:MAG: hypothetical protein LBL90_11820 [Prevotellaceae bacterium]|nr:hypothetical protein [Prevotellaceae bacterium]